eukprot:PITA_32560
MELIHKLQQDTSDNDVDYCLTADGLVRFSDRMYVPDENELKKLILREFHANPYSGHPGYQKILTAVKAECKHPSGLLQPILIPEWKWEVISMDFITGFTRTSKQHDSIMVVVDNLTKVAHFIPVKSTYLANDVVEVFIRDVVRLHGVLKKIVSDRDGKFTSRF